MKFLVDNQLPPALARLIETEFGEEASHVADLGLAGASDAELWSHVTETDSVLISKDEDFVNLVLRVPTARLVWVRVGNCRKAALLNLFRGTWPRILNRLQNDDRFIEVR